VILTTRGLFAKRTPHKNVREQVPSWCMPTQPFAPSSDIILLCLTYVRDTSTWLWLVDLMMTRADTALGDIVFALVPLVHLPLSRRRILLVVSPPVYREPPGVSAIEDLIFPKA
jgi:hypothetical protein